MSSSLKHLQNFNIVSFYILVHNPYGIPEVRGKGIAIGENVESFFAIKAYHTLEKNRKFSNMKTPYNDYDFITYSHETSSSNINYNGSYIKKLKKQGNILHILHSKISALKVKAQYSKDAKEMDTIQQKIEKFQKSYDNIVKSSSILHFYYKENQIVKYQRTALYTTTDFLASVGGIIGITIGMSLVSIFEIVFGFFIPLIVNFAMLCKKYL